LLFFVAVFYFPVIVLINHKRYTSMSAQKSVSSESATVQCLRKLVESWSTLKAKINSRVNQVTESFEVYSSQLIRRKKLTLAILFATSVFIGSYSLNLDIDDVATSQLLFDSHPFELYDRKYDPKFRSSSLNLDNSFNMAIVFGVQNSNTVEPFNPSLKRSAQFNSLNVSGVQQQALMYSLCQDMITEKGKQGLNISLQNIRCYPFFFQQWMSVPCDETMNSTSPDTSSWLTPQRMMATGGGVSCCGYNQEQVAYSEEEFLTCSYQWSKTYGGFDTGLWWDPANGQIIAVTIGMESRQKFSNDYTDALDYWDWLDRWTGDYFKETELRTSYSTSDMALFRYQRGLIVGFTVVSPLCICIGALVVYFMSRNILAAISVFVSTYMILWILAGSIALYDERLSLFISMSVTSAIAVGCGLSSFLSHSYCEAGHAGTVCNDDLGLYLGREVTPLIFGLTATACLASVCLLGSQTYFSFG
jgi:hypothetical protein